MNTNAPTWGACGVVVNENETPMACLTAFRIGHNRLQEIVGFNMLETIVEWEVWCQTQATQGIARKESTSCHLRRNLKGKSKKHALFLFPTISSERKITTPIDSIQSIDPPSIQAFQAIDQETHKLTLNRKVRKQVKNRKKSQDMGSQTNIMRASWAPQARKILLLAMAVVLGTTTVHAANSQIRINPTFFNVSSQTLDPPKTYKWLLVEDDVGTYDGDLGQPNHPCNIMEMSTNKFPANCSWPSIRTIKTSSAIYASGDNTQWNSTAFLALPEGMKFMVTVMAEGYRLCGGYFTVPKNKLTVDMACQKHPLPLGTIRIFVFNDSAPCNGQYDGPLEEPLADFGIGTYRFVCEEREMGRTLAPSH
jgi:hypothetical protein